MVVTFWAYPTPIPPYFQPESKCVRMTHNGLKHILNMFLKSVMKDDLEPPQSSSTRAYVDE